MRDAPPADAIAAGGGGRHRGGDGCTRDIEFTEDLDVAILSQRRVIPPYGMAGGEPGTVGENYWLKKTKDMKGVTKINLGGSNQCRVSKGDHIVISESFGLSQDGGNGADRGRFAWWRRIWGAGDGG